MAVSGHRISGKDFLREVNRFRGNPAAYLEEMCHVLEFRQNVETEVTREYTTTKNAIVFPSGAMVETANPSATATSTAGEEEEEDGGSTGGEKRSSLRHLTCLESLKEDVLALGYDPAVTEFPFGLPILKWSDELSEACSDHVGDLCGNDFYSHIGTDGTTPEERIVKYGAFSNARFPSYHAAVDKIRAKTTARKMNNTTNHKFRDRSQSTNVDSALLNAGLAKLGEEIPSPPASPMGGGGSASAGSGAGAVPGPGGGGGGATSVGSGGGGAAGGSGLGMTASDTGVKKGDGNRKPDRKEEKNAVPYQVAENIHFGLHTARDIVYHFLLDDQDPHRGHRQNLLNRDFHQLGFAFSNRHPSALTCACVLFTDASFFPKKPPVIRLELAQELVKQPNPKYQDDTYYDVVPLRADPPKARLLAAPGAAGGDKSRSGVSAAEEQFLNNDLFQLDTVPGKTNVAPKAGFSNVISKDVSGDVTRRNSGMLVNGGGDSRASKTVDIHDIVRAHRQEMLNKSSQVSKTNTITSSIVTKEDATGDYHLKKSVATTTWQDVCDLIKPAQYALAKKQAAQIPDLVKPLKRFWRYIPARNPYPKSFLGGVDPGSFRHVAKPIVRAWLHHVSEKGNPRIEEAELSQMLERFNVYKLRPAYNENLVTEIFDEIIERRPIELQKFRDISDQEVFDAVSDKREWAPVITITCFPEKSDRQQTPYELIARTELIDEWLLKLCADYQSIGFFAGGKESGMLGGLSGYYRAFGEELCRFMKRSSDFRAEVLGFLQRPASGVDRRAISKSADKNEDVVEQMHEIKFHNPRKLWVFSRRPNADVWLDMMALLDHNPVNHRAHQRNDHFFNGHLLDIQPNPVPKKNTAKETGMNVVRSKVFDGRRSDAWYQNQGAIGVLGGTYLFNSETGEGGSAETDLENLLKVPIEKQNSVEVKKVVEKPLAMCKSLRPEDQYPGEAAVADEKIAVGEIDDRFALTELQEEARAACSYVNETILVSDGEKQAAAAAAARNIGGNNKPAPQLKFTLDGSKRTFRRALAKSERMSCNRAQLQKVLLDTAALTGVYDQRLSTWRNDNDNERAGTTCGGGGVHQAGPSTVKTDPPPSDQMTTTSALGGTATVGQEGGHPAVAGATGGIEVAGGSSSSTATMGGTAATSFSLTRASKPGDYDNINKSVRAQIYGPLLSTTDAVCGAADKMPLITTGDSVSVLGAGGIRLLRPAQYSLAQTLPDAYASSILTSKQKAITFGTCAIEQKQRGGLTTGGSSPSSGLSKIKGAYSTLNPNAVFTSPKQMYVHTWYNALPTAGDSMITQLGAMPVALTSGIDAKSKIKPLRYKNSECGNIELSAGQLNDPERNNFVDTPFSSVKHPYNNHGIFYHNINNKTSNTVSGTHLELNAQRLSQKQTKSTLSLDHAELCKYVATDQGPVTNAVNHADLGAHLDHSKYVQRGADYDKTAKLPVSTRFRGQMLTRNLELCPSPRQTKIQACPGTRAVSGAWKAYKPHVFRADEPERNGRFGPRKFTAENLGERPLALPISGIETLPNPDRITNFLNIEGQQSKDANLNVSVVREATKTKQTEMKMVPQQTGLQDPYVPEMLRKTPWAG